jgi:hypothetical protein
MSGGQLNTQVRGQAQPRQDNRFETAAGIPSHREKDDSYRSVIIQFAPRWRVIICKDGAQWIVQHRTADSLHRGVWRGRSYMTTRDSLIKACARLEPLSDPSVMAILSALPDRIGSKHEQRIEPHSPTKNQQHLR